MRPLVKWMLATWAIVAIGTAAGVTYLLATGTGSTKAPVPDEPALTETTGEGATPLLGAKETGGESKLPDGATQPHPSDGIDETQYHEKPKPPRKPRKPGKKKGRGNRKNKTSTSDDGGLEKTDISASRG